MDELNQKLEDILNDPESMKKVRSLAESLLGDDSDTGPENRETQNSAVGISGADIGRIMGVLGKINGADDSRTKLLLALKPHLSQRRREKVDSAIKLLKLIEALPLLKESGILDFG